MGNYDIKELQKCILNILLAVDKVCREHGIRYWLSDGTMLGAVRHGGFIPWDDDADIAMPRPDYQRFILSCKPSRKTRTARVPSLKSSMAARL